jgi:two-component system sensor histidine kinase MtrB
VIRRPGLRTRLVVAFGLGSVALATLIAVVSYVVARSALVNQRESGASRTARAHAMIVNDALDRAPSGSSGLSPTMLGDLVLSPSVALVYIAGGWVVTGPVQPQQLPPSLREGVGGGMVTTARFTIANRPLLGVGVPLRARQAQYYEVVPLSELQNTLDTFRLSLIVVGVGAAVLGGTVGWWASRRLLQPLDRVAVTSRRIASGRLTARLPATRDPQLGELTTAFNDMADALADRITRESQFTANVSHELRTPLTTLTAALSVLQARRAELPVRAQTAADLAGGEARRLANLVEDLLEMARADSNVPLEADYVSLAELVRTIAAQRAPAAAVSVECDEALVWGEKRRLERVLANLLDNAAQHGNGALAVRACAVEAAIVRIEVDDAGPGVPLDERERIFERFARGKAAARGGARPSGGLGLALVRKHVADHGGRVWVEDRPGGGARFVVELPAEPRPATDLADAADPANPDRLSRE